MLPASVGRATSPDEADENGGRDPHCPDRGNDWDERIHTGWDSENDVIMLVATLSLVIN